MDKFTLVLGEENNVLPGKLWTEYSVEITEKEMICTAKKDQNTLVKIPFDSFTKAEFGIGSGNLWLQCKVENDSLVFCSPRKCWKSEQGKLLIEKINSVVEVEDMKAYNSYTGPFFFFYMFK